MKKRSRETKMNSAKEYGQFLKEERERQGLTLEEVSKATRITIKMLSGLESMDKELFPSETYHIGMLKVYARYLKIDQNIILDMLKINEIQEKPVEFDLINLQAEKRKKRKKFFTVLSLIILSIGVGWGGYVSVITIMAMNAEKKEKQELSIDKLEKIDGFYESNFTINEKLVLVGKDVEGIFEITSIDPPVIKLDDSEFELTPNTPLQLDMNNDGTVEYGLLLRQVNLSRKQLLLRFDPSLDANSASVISQDDLTGGFANVASDGEEIEIITGVSQTPIQLVVEFTQDSYYKLLDDEGKTKEEAAVSRGREKSFTSNSSLQLLLSNSSFVNIVVNNKPVDIPKNGLPFTFYLGWKYKDGKSVLTLIPTP